LLALRPGVRADAALQQIERVGAAANGGQDVLVITPFVPAQLAQIRDVRALPVALGWLLIVLAVGGVGQTLAMAVRSRLAELAVLRALGMTPRQARVVIWTQANVIAALAIILGVPLGLALGRVLWRVTADIMPLQYRAPTPWSALLLVVPAVFAAALVLAALPGRRAARFRLADALRTE
jgi:ABC-type antimicrobial peptide transport system permease subunit